MAENDTPQADDIDDAGSVGTIIQEVDDDQSADLPADEAAEASQRMDLTVEIEDIGPCKKSIRVIVPQGEIERVQNQAVSGMMDTAQVPGFRSGHIPEALIRKRFKTDINGQVKQDILMQSLEQIAEDNDIDPINEPNINVDAIDIPDEGDLEYEFDVEVRPAFDLPNYKGLSIRRPTRDVTDEDVEEYLGQYLEQYGHLEPTDEVAIPGDFVTAAITFTHQDKVINKIDEISLRIRPTLRFQDGELENFEALMTGAKAGDTKDAMTTVSMESDMVAMRGEQVECQFKILDVKTLDIPTSDEDFLERTNFDNEAALRNAIRSSLERQVTYDQRQSTREQVLEQITASADWELPEDLVAKQVENALRREVLEMRQAGFTPHEIRAKENELRQNSLTMTRQNLKEHFVLDKIAEEENVEVSKDDVEMEITMMALQSGENPRRVRSRLIKSGMIENLEAQIRERMAVDVILETAEFVDEPMKRESKTEVEAVNRSICRSIADTIAPEADDDADDNDESDDEADD